jgi:hypothetical protein
MPRLWLALRISYTAEKHGMFPCIVVTVEDFHQSALESPPEVAVENA